MILQDRNEIKLEEEKKKRVALRVSSSQSNYSKSEEIILNLSLS